MNRLTPLVETVLPVVGVTVAAASTTIKEDWTRTAIAVIVILGAIVTEALGHPIPWLQPVALIVVGYYYGQAKASARRAQDAALIRKVQTETRAETKAEVM